MWADSACNLFLTISSVELPFDMSFSDEEEAGEDSLETRDGENCS